jgi:Cu(I)/Ag(I) efflux system membrane fusion protein
MPAVVAEASAAFTADVEGRPVVPGVVDAAPSYVDTTSRTAPVRIRTDDGAHRLLPGVSGSVAIEVGPLRDAVVVPEVAVVYDERRPLVFVDDGHGGFTATPVRLGVIRAGRVEVAEGVAAGARVATTGAASLLSASRLGASGAD